MGTGKGDPRDTLELNPIGSHSDGVDVSSAVTLTPPTGATKLLIQALDTNLRVTLDGTTPTTAKGFQLVAGDPPLLIPLGINTIVKVIEEAASCDLQYQWGGG
jgi:hypothetical protein